MKSSIRKFSGRLLWGILFLGVLGGIFAAAWKSLTYEPGFYREIVELPRTKREANAKQFVATSLQLTNDIRNESTWEAVFTDQEVNAWLAQDLLTHFNEHLPSEVSQPRVVFEMDRIILGFRYRQQGIDTVITVMAKARIPRDNTVELLVEKVRAGILPVFADGVLDRITGHARSRGIDVSWKRRDGYPVVTLFYSPNLQREDVRLEDLQLRGGQLKLSGRSDRTRNEVQAARSQPQKVLQSGLPTSRRKDQSNRRSSAL